MYTKGQIAGGWIHVSHGTKPIALVHPKYVDKFIAAPELYEALKIAIEDLKIHLGEWVCVTLTYSPEWTHAIKRTISDLEEALCKAEVK